MAQRVTWVFTPADETGPLDREHVPNVLNKWIEAGWEVDSVSSTPVSGGNHYSAGFTKGIYWVLVFSKDG